MENLKLCYMIIMLYYYLDKSTCIIVALIWYSRFVLYRIVFLIKKREINEIFFREGAYDWVTDFRPVEHASAESDEKNVLVVKEIYWFVFERF